MSGWIKLHRRLLGWEWYDDHNTLRLFTHFLLTCNYEPETWRGKPIGVGQRIIGRKKLASESGLSEQQIRTCLRNLQSTNDITIKSTKEYSLITVVNWIEYQESNQQPNQQTTSQTTTPKEVKKERSKEYMCDFDSFWGLYPKKKAKPKALQSYVQARGKTDHQTIMVGLTRYAAEQTDPQYTAHASTWLNQERWNDEEQKRKPSNPNQEKRSNKEVL